MERRLDLRCRVGDRRSGRLALTLLLLAREAVAETARSAPLLLIPPITAASKRWAGAVDRVARRSSRASGRVLRALLESSPGTWCKSSAPRSSVRLAAAQAAWSWATSSLISLSV